MSALVFGSFAPFHKGHQFLIEMALKENERVVVQVFDRPGLIAASVTERADWIAETFAHNPRLVIVPCRIDAGNSPTGRPQPQTLALIKDHLPAGIDITGVYCNRPEGRTIAASLGARWYMIDPDRHIFPIESAVIRSNPMANRDNLPDVIADKTVAACLASGRGKVIPFRTPALS